MTPHLHLRRVSTIIFVLGTIAFIISACGQEPTPNPTEVALVTQTAVAPALADQTTPMPVSTDTPTSTDTPAPTDTPATITSQSSPPFEAVAKRDTKTWQGPDRTIYPETGQLTKGQRASIVGQYKNSLGELWYQLEDGNWVWSIWLNLADEIDPPDVKPSNIPTPLTPQPIFGEVNYVARVMAGPSQKSEVLATLYAGESLEILGSYKYWYKIRGTDKNGESIEGWVTSVSVESPEAKKVKEITPTAKELALTIATPTPTPTSTPNPEQEKRQLLANGYIFPKKTVNLRSGPGTMYSKMGVAQASEPLKIIGQYKLLGYVWYQVRDKNNRKVWIRSDLVDIDETLTVPQVPDAEVSLVPFFLGDWYNESLASGGITKVTIRTDGKTMFVHILGKCLPSDCDWGEITAKASDAHDGAFTLYHVTSFSESTLNLRLLNGNRLQIIDSVHYTDNSGRPDRQFVDTLFHCRAPSKKVLIDASYDGGVWWFPQRPDEGFDTSRHRQGRWFSDYLSCMGFEVTELPRGTQITQELLNNYSLVIRTGGGGGYLESEVNAYLNYVSGKGRVLLLSGALLPQRSDAVAEAFGIQFGGGTQGDQIIDKFVPHPITQGMTTMHYGWGSGILAAPDSSTLLAFLSQGTYLDMNNNKIHDADEPTGSPVIGSMTYGNGKIIFSGTTYAWLESPYPLLQNSIRWLLK